MKIKDLTLEDFIRICFENNCKDCPLKNMGCSTNNLPQTWEIDEEIEWR